MRLKSDEEQNKRLEEEPEQIADPNKYKGCLGTGTADMDKIGQLPTYTAPPVMEKEGLNVNSNTRRIIFRIIGLIFLVIIGFTAYKLTVYLTGDGGEDITADLDKDEEELAAKYDITFKDNDKRVKAIPNYSTGKMTVRSGKDLHLIYINGKRVGINTDSRDYRFFDVGINQPAREAMNNMSYEYEMSMIIGNDLMGGSSDSYYYYNTKKNDCFVLTVNGNSNRIVNMTYFTDFKKMTERLVIDDGDE